MQYDHNPPKQTFHCYLTAAQLTDNMFSSVLPVWKGDALPSH